jgi:hypothetical protein
VLGHNNEDIDERMGMRKYRGTGKVMAERY